MKIKAKSFLAIITTILSTILLSVILIVNAKTYNVPKYDDDIVNPGSGSGLSAPVTKFDVFSTDTSDDKNYATNKIINIPVSEAKTFILDYYTINWYASYPIQELTFEVEDNEIIDINYYRNGVTSGTSSKVSNSKTILDNNLPERVLNEKINTDFPELSFEITGLKEGITCLNITVKSEHEYGNNQTTEETLKILINVSSKELIDIPNYINLYLGSGIHSGAKQIKYVSEEKIGILNDIVSSVSIIEPIEVTNYNDESVDKIMHRILTDDKILVQNDSLSFIDASSEASFTVEYYVLTSENLEIEIASYSFGVIFYNLSDFEIKYNGTSFPDNGVYESGAKITIETSERLKPYLSDLIVAYIPTSAVDVLPYEGDSVYVINKVSDETNIIIGDKLMALSGLANYESTCQFINLTLKPDNVIAREYPREIELDENYVFEMDKILDEIIEITNINAFNENTIFNIISDGVINVSLTEKNQIKLNYEAEESITTTLRTILTVEAKLDNGVTLTKTIAISLVPGYGYKYTFNTVKVTLLEGETKTITLGYLDPDFIEIAGDAYVSNYYLKNGNAMIIQNRTSRNKFDIFGHKVGTDTAYFVIYDQVVEVEITINDKNNNNRIVQFDFLEGSNLSVLASNSKTYLTIPDEYLDLNFNFIVLDNEILTIESVNENRLSIKGLKDGTTQIFAYAQKDNVFYNAVINIKIITTLPRLYIVYDKEDTTKSLTKYDTIKISYDASNFDFSQNTIYRWYLNDELIYDNVKEFERNFDEGINTLKLVIIDSDNNIELETTQQLMISSVENIEKTLSINADKIIYVDLHQGNFEISALLDGVLDPNYKYLWSISNSSVCRISINGNEKIILEPLYVGEVDLTVMTNISKYEEIFIKSEIKIVVIEPTYKVIGNTFIKPNTDQTFEFLGDGKTIYNLKPILEIDVDGQKFEDYTISNKGIKINKIKKGKYSINANINGETVELNFDATNFNLKEVVKIVLPYLFVICIIVIVVTFALKKHLNKLDWTKQKINNLDKSVDKVLKDKKVTKKEIKHLLKNSKKAKKMLTYCIDEGIDELSIVLPIIDQIIMILTATFNTDVKEETMLVIVNNIKNKNVSRLVKEFTIIKNERDEFEQKKKDEDEVITKKPQKERNTKDSYREYLELSKYTESDNDE